MSTFNTSITTADADTVVNDIASVTVAYWSIRGLAGKENIIYIYGKHTHMYNCLYPNIVVYY